MADIKPFHCVRPPSELAEKVSELPYDVCSSREARQKAADNPCNFYRISKPEITLPEETDPYSEQVYARGRQNLESFLNDGYLIQDETPALFLYTLEMGNTRQTGLVCVVSVDDYEKGIIKKHEYTRKAKERDRIRHIETLNAQTGPVFLMFRQSKELASLFTQAMNTSVLFDFTGEDGVRHTGRRIQDERLIGQLGQAFAPLDLYIADGHHRAASALSVGKSRRQRGIKDGSDYFLSVIFPDDELTIMPYNRALKDLNGMSSEEFFDALGTHFIVEKQDTKIPSQSGSFCVYFQSQWYTLTPRFSLPQGPVESLDVQILQERVLQPLFKIDDPRTDERIDFIGGIRGPQELERIVDNGEFAVAFSMFPTTISQLLDVAETGNVMPPKSTWFEPKLRSGLFVHLFKE